MEKPVSGFALPVLSGVLAGVGALQLLLMPNAVEPTFAALTAIVTLIPAGFFLGLYTAQPRVEIEERLEDVPDAPESAVIVPFKRRAR